MLSVPPLSLFTFSDHGATSSVWIDASTGPGSPYRSSIGSSAKAATAIELKAAAPAKSDKTPRISEALETLGMAPPFFRPRFRGASLAIPRSGKGFTQPFRPVLLLRRLRVDSAWAWLSRRAAKGREAMTGPKKLDQPPKYWDRLFAPSSCLAMITTVDTQGRVNAASYGTCTRVHHEPVFIAFTANVGADNANNILAGSDFVVNLPRWERESLEKVRVVGLPFAPGVSEIAKAGLTALPSTIVKPPRIAECPRHFECKVEWTKEW